jgi:hypothetical protein
MRRAALLSLLVVLPLLAQDSALVEAARNSRRGKSKAKVITNADLGKKGGHLTTTKSQEPLKVATTTTTSAPAKKHVPVKHAAAHPKRPVPPEPVDDAMVPDVEDMHPDNVRDPGPPAHNIPPQIAAQPQFSQPHVVPPVTPQYTEKPKN